MSDAAERYVQTVTHPQVKGGTRALLLAIAAHVPEGQTTTPPMTLDDLALTAQHTGRTAQTCRNLLEAIGLITVHDGGRGNKARYELPGLAGVRPITATPLPLLGQAKPRRATDQRPPSPLFAAPAHEETANNVGSFFLRFASVLKKVGSFFLRCASALLKVLKVSEGMAINVGSFFLRWRDRTIRQRRTSDPTFAAHIDRARDVGVREERSGGGDARAREPADEFLDWFEATYPTVHYGAAVVVHRPRDGPLVRELLQRPRTDVAHLQAMTTCLWAITTDGVKNSDRWWIADVVAVRGIAVLHRKADFLDQEVRRAAATDAAPDDVWLAVLAGIEQRLNRQSYFTWWGDSVLVEDRGEVLHVQLHDDLKQHALRKEWVQKHYAGALAESLAEVRPGARVEFVVAAVGPRRMQA